MSNRPDYWYRARFQGIGAGAGSGAPNEPSSLLTIPIDTSIAPTDGQALVYSAANGMWQPKAAGGGLSAINDKAIMANSTGGSAAPAGNDMSGFLDYCFGSAQGSILYRDAAAWKVLAPGTSGNFLKSQGAAANPIWSAASQTPFFVPQFLTYSNFSYSKAAHGNVVTPQANLSLSDVWVLFTTVTGATYKVGIAPWNGGTLAMTSAPTYTGSVTVGTGQANGWIKCSFGASQTLTSGTAYIIFIVRTDAGDTGTVAMNFINQPISGPGYYAAANSIFNLAKAAPATTDTWTTDTGTFIIIPVWTA